MPAALVAACAVSGALAGAFVPRVAYRMSVDFGAPPRSACARCAAPFPRGVAGWVRAGDRCPRCAARLGPAARLAAAAGALACGLLAWCLDPVRGDAVPGAGGAPDPRDAAAATAVLAAFLLVAVAGVLLTAIDLACLRLPDRVVAPALGGALALLGAASAVTGAAGDLVRAVVAALALASGYLVLALLPGGHLGLGDVKLCLPLGLLLGWLGWPAVLLGAALPHVVNGPVALGLLMTRRAGRRTALPLGPALLAGALLAVVAHSVLRLPD
ncbi:MAG TPA: prepilin peptidase [Pilimelia sp.]|nr:prepilin peptidase [Pilimelia sp.]